MSTWSSLLIKQKTYEITKLLPETEYTVSINGIYNQPIEVWLTTLIKDENGIVETGVNQNNAIFAGNLKYNKLTFTAQEAHTALVIRTLGDLDLNTIQLEKGALGTDWVPSHEDFNTLKGIRYSLSRPLQKDQYYTLSLESEVNKFVGAWLGDDVHLGYLKDNKLAFKLTEQLNRDHIILKSLSEKGVMSKIKLEQDVVATSYSPAPEDGYNYTGEDCGYHIEASGGSNPLKLVKNLISAAPAGDLYSTSAQIHAFSKLLVRNNLGSIARYLPGEGRPYSAEGVGNGSSNFQFQFAGNSASESLDFITSSPIAIVGAIDELPKVGDTMAISPVDVDRPLEYKTLNNHGQWSTMPSLGPLERSDFYSEYYPELAGLWFEDRYNPNYTLKDKDLYGYHFDIIEGSEELSKFSVNTIGRRRKPVDDKDVKQLYPTIISDVLVYYDEEDLEYSTNPASAIKIEDPALFRTYPTVGNVYKDAFSTIKDNLFAHTSYNEQVTITSLPVYTLEPNRRCYIEFPKAAIYGYFLVKKVSFNLDQNGLMNATMIKLNRRDQ